MRWAVLLVLVIGGCSSADPPPEPPADFGSDAAPLDVREVDQPDIPHPENIPDVTDEGAPDDTPDVPDAPEVTDPSDPSDTSDIPDVPDTLEIPDTPDEGPDVADSDNDTGPDVEPVCEPTPLDLPAAQDITLTLGRKPPGGFVPLLDGDPIEIVQGPQGGVHLDLAYSIEIPQNDADKLFTVVHARTSQACCGDQEAIVGTYQNNKEVVFPAGGGVFLSEEVSVIFEQDEASVYQGQDCCVQIHVQVMNPPPTVVHSATTTRTLSCEDVF